MNLYIVDFIIAAIIIISALIGLYRGILISLLYFAALFVNIALSVATFPLIKPFLTQKAHDPDLVIMIGYSILFVGYFFLTGIIFFMIKLLLKPFSQGILDRLIGSIFGLCRGCGIIILVVLVSLYSFSITHGLKPKEQPLEEFMPSWLKNAKSYPYVLLASQTSLNFIPEFIEETLNTWYNDLSKSSADERFAKAIATKLENALPTKELETHKADIKSSNIPESDKHIYSIKKLYHAYLNNKEEGNLLEDSLSEHETSRLNNIISAVN